VVITVLFVSGAALVLLYAGSLFLSALDKNQNRKSNANFDRQFPSISDDEFLARCRAGTDREVALKVRRIVSEQFGIEYDRIYPSSRFVEDLGIG
jgi:hypothetical protein